MPVVEIVWWRFMAQQRTMGLIKRILMGGSAGSFEQMLTLLSDANHPLFPPVVFVMHLSESFTSDELVRAFSKATPLKVVPVHHHEHIKPGHLYIPSGHYHMTLVDQGRRVQLFDDEPFCYSKPSIDLLFQSCLGTEAKSTMAVVLSGANADGVQGLKALSQAGAQCVVIEPSECLFDLMPRAALQEVPTAHRVSLGDRLLDLLEYQVA